MLNCHRVEHAKPLLRRLRLLPIDQRMKYKTSCLCYQIIIGTAPQLLAELGQIYVTSGSLRSSLNDITFCIPTWKENEGEWTMKVGIKTRKKFLAVGEACVTIF